MKGYRVFFVDSWLSAALLAVASFMLVAAMPAWQWIWAPATPPKTYHVTAESFLARVDAMIATYGTGEQTKEGYPVVHPPPGDIYLAAHRFYFTPVLELEIGHTYRLHVATVDSVHGFVFPIASADLLLLPGWAIVLQLTPTANGRYTMQCSEYCGLSHSRMKGWIQVIGTTRY